MNIEVEIVGYKNKAKMAVTFKTESIGSFTVDTAYKPAAEILNQFERFYNEITTCGGVCVNLNGVIIHDKDEQKSDD